MEKKYNKIASLVDENPLFAFEDFLLKVRDEKELDLEVWNLFYNSILKQLEISLEDQAPIDVIFNRDLSKSDRRFIAICFLRLMGVNHYIVNTRDIKERKVFKLLDEMLPSIYKHPKISLLESDDSHKKSEKLGEYIATKERELREAKNSLKELSDVNQFKHNFFRVYRDKVLKQIFPLFIPSQLTNSLEKISGHILEYIDLTGRVKISSYKEIIIKINSLLQEIEKGNNPFWNKIIRSITQYILKLVEEDFKASPLSKPAILKINPFDKKYPLSILKSNFRISLDLVNEGLGTAFNVKLSILDYSEGILIPKTTQEITVIAHEKINVKFNSEVLTTTSDVILELELSWTNADSSNNVINNDIIIEGQKTHVDWEELKYEDPYNQEPVENEDELIGRTEVLKKLYTGVTKSKVASYYIWGQRRVGKTSIVKSLENKIAEDSNLPNTHIIYLECGDFKSPKPEKTIASLGIKICKFIKLKNARFSKIEIPTFDEAFNSITDFFDEVSIISPNSKILIILDEFDQISPELYTRTEKANSFFLTIRSISNRSNFGFILVGGEVMELVMSCQGEKINKFRSIQVDYFDREKEWSDFQDLVEKPIYGMGLTIAKGVIDKLYEYTLGNPYYTKMICETLFNDIIERRDSYITTEEVEDAIQETIKNIEKNSFIHFWEDGIKKDSSKKEAISIQRRLILKSLATAMNKWKEKIQRENIVDEASNYTILNEVDIRDCISEFERRRILIIDGSGIRLKVKLFEE
jgi:hypothetical protein